jgi:Uma2 family endonuclease
VTVASRRYTIEDYLEVEEVSVVRHEYVDGAIFAMAGGTPEHAALSAAILVVLGSALRGSACRGYSSDLRVRVLATGLATYPAAAVICGEVSRDPASPTHVTNPSVLFEVLSPKTEAYDRGQKWEHYQQIPSLKEYVLVRQDRAEIEVFSRTEHAGSWDRVLYEQNGRAKIPSLKLEIDVDALYADDGIKL